MDLAVTACENYEEHTVRQALETVLAPLGGLDWVTPGMKIAVKANLVTFMRPESGAVTHPALVSELCRLLVQRGAQPIVGDSPGGPYNAANLGMVYSKTGMKAVETVGGVLNRNFEQVEAIFPEAAVLKSFPYTAWLSEADAVINFCKLKTHGLTGMSCAVKNLFGAIPGTRKPEYHYLYPRTETFCDMLIDLCEYIKPRLTIVDAVDCMEGNGPTQGTVRHMGALLASQSAYAADLAAAYLMGLPACDAPTVLRAARRGLCTMDLADLSVSGDLDAFVAADFKKLPVRDSIRFSGRSPLLLGLLGGAFGSRPLVLPDKCIACGRCVEACPIDAVSLRGPAVIDRKRCIRCFCCQEFCPVGAIEVKRAAAARILGK